MHCCAQRVPAADAAVLQRAHGLSGVHLGRRPGGLGGCGVAAGAPVPLAFRWRGKTKSSTHPKVASAVLPGVAGPGSDSYSRGRLQAASSEASAPAAVVTTMSTTHDPAEPTLAPWNTTSCGRDPAAVHDMGMEWAPWAPWPAWATLAREEGQLPSGEVNESLSWARGVGGAEGERIRGAATSVRANFEGCLCEGCE